jgi:hypothetical protein
MKTQSTLNLRSSVSPMKKLGLAALGFLSLVLLTSYEAQAQARLILNGDIVVNLHGGSSSNPISLVVDNSATNSISSTGGGRINSEGQFNVLQWNVENGIGNYIVPFADNSSNPLPMSVNITTAGSNDGAIRFAMYGTGQNNLPMPQGVSSITHQDIIGDGLPAPDADGAKLYDRYWFITPTNYTTNPEGTMGFSYLTTSLSGDLIAGTTNMAAQSHNGTAWTVSQFGSDNLNGNVTGVPFNSTNFNATWTLVESGAPLPITLLSFNAVWANNRQSQARVYWSTASEENNDYFDVQRSADGANWQHVARVQGAGTSINTLNYQILDKNPLHGISYYRLRQVDFDGTATLTHVVSLKREIYEAAISVYPNPANNQFQISFEGFKSEEVSVNILDNSGRIIMAKTNNVLNNPVQIINASGFQSGVYYIHVTSETESFVEKIVIKN